MADLVFIALAFLAISGAIAMIVNRCIAHLEF